MVVLFKIEKYFSDWHQMLISTLVLTSESRFWSYTELKQFLCLIQVENQAFLKHFIPTFQDLFVSKDYYKHVGNQITKF